MFAGAVLTYQLHELVAKHLFSAVLLVGGQLLRNSVEQPH